MSSPGIQPINSGPLIIRTYNQSVSTLSTNNTYLLGQYETPISSNYILITTLNGQLAPTNFPTVSSFNISTLNINNGRFSTLTGSTINPCTIIGSTLTLSGTALFTPTTQLYIQGQSLDALYRNKYIFIKGLTEEQNNVSISATDGPPNGTFMSLTNLSNFNFTINKNRLSIGSTIYPGSTIMIMYYDGWNIISQN